MFNTIAWERERGEGEEKRVEVDMWGRLSL